MVYHQWGKSHVKKIPKFVKVSQNKSVQKNKNAENWKKLKSLPSGTCIVLSMKKQAEGQKTPENAFPGLMDAKESISGLISKKNFGAKVHFCGTAFK